MAATKLATFPAGSILVTAYVNATERVLCGVDELPLENCLHCTTLEDGSIQADKGKLFRLLTKEHGRCTGKVYVDRKDDVTIHAGWMFQKRSLYADSRETYMQETWATFATVTPRKVSHIPVP